MGIAIATRDCPGFHTDSQDYRMMKDEQDKMIFIVETIVLYDLLFLFSLFLSAEADSLTTFFTSSYHSRPSMAGLPFFTFFTFSTFFTSSF